jgi:O-acetyl-ADP-ribose deacetylase (regulator of RNase III)
MSVSEYYEDIFESPAKTLINPTNTQGFMGKGLAKVFREKVPGLYLHYRRLCEEGKIGPNSIWRYKWPGSDQQVICLPTKTIFRAESNFDMVADNIYKLAANIGRLEIESLAIPPVGCGEGGLDWNEIRDVIIDAFTGRGIEVRMVLGKK